MKRLVLILWVTPTSLAAYAAHIPKPVFVKATCDAKPSTVLLSFLEEALQTSNRYELVANLGDNGKMDVVLTVNMVCAERDSLIGVASVYGMVKCFGPENAITSIDGSSEHAHVRSQRGSAMGERTFQEFEFVLSKSNSQLRLQ
jgi:hypothetical protein